MTPLHRRRRNFVLLLLGALVVSTALALYALGENLLYFYTPTQIAAKKTPHQQIINLGGVVLAESVLHSADAQVRFALTDYRHTVYVEYSGLLPDLFREGQGIVATGRMRRDGVFVADRVLAKHDEEYMPPEVAESLGKTISIKDRW